ncbi:Pentatricopeptide repeat-containing protein [Apostasia shenzhenica]|uniref:Pentatricopeptide repeat-containing protein n=1 Tax=Apostasia shenzhenica TaxID=1088818 RepID=A0A2I0A3K9_9ASPA|nr:Pentatricopeptide repeat-containing protein [Apostasia shenzhenica]
MLGVLKPSSRNIIRSLLVPSICFLHSSNVAACFSSSGGGYVGGGGGGGGGYFVPLNFLPSKHPIPQSEDLGSSIAPSFSDWFRHRADPLRIILEQIYRAFAFSEDEAGLNAALSHLRLRPTEELVLRFLHHNPHPSVVLPSSDYSNSLLELRIRFFEWCERQPNYVHTRSVYHAVFRHLFRHDHVSFVLDCLQRFSDTGYFSFSMGSEAFNGGRVGNFRFLQTLVIGYAVAGCAERALQLFARMRFYGLDLDNFSYNVLLNSLVEASLFDFADSVFAQVDARGPAGPVANCIRVKSLCRQNRLDEAAAYLQELCVGDHRAVTYRTVRIVIDAFCKAGRFEYARELVEDLGTTDSYNAWISHLLMNGKVDACLEFLRNKGIDRYPSDAFQYYKLIQVLLRKNLLEEAFDVLVEMIEEGISPDQRTMDATVCFFCKVGMVDVAFKLYRLKMELGMAPKRCVYNHLIKSLCQNGNVRRVLQVLEECMNQGFFPGNQTFSRVAYILLREGMLDKLRSLLAEAQNRKLRSTSHIHSQYVSALCKSGAVQEAYSELLTATGGGAGFIRHRSVYCDLIQAFIQLGMVQFPPQLLIQMQMLGLDPSQRVYRDVVSSLCDVEMYDLVLSLLDKQLEINKWDPRTCYNYIIDGIVHSKCPSMAMEVYNRMVKAGIKPNRDTKILILRCYMKSGCFADAFSFFRDLMKKHKLSTKLFNVFLSGLCEAGRVKDSVELWKEMREKRLLPSLQCYEELVRALCFSSSYDDVVKIIKDIEETGRQFSPFICNVLLLHTLKSHDLLSAWNRSNKGGATSGVISKHSTYSSENVLCHIMKAFSQGIREKKNLEKLDEVIEKYFPLDLFTYNILLRALFKAGKIENAYIMFCKLQRKGYEPNRWTYDIIVHGLCKLGHTKLAEKWMEEMYQNGYEPTWYTLSLYNKPTY